MIVVRPSEDRNSLAAFLFPLCLNDLAHKSTSLSLTPELLLQAIASWNIVEFFDTKKEAIIGAAACEPNRYVHIYVDSVRRASWAPHTSISGALDIFLSDSQALYAAIPLTNRNTISMVRKMGFIRTSIKEGVAFHKLTPQTRLIW
jgi:hypothetical protein